MNLGRDRVETILNDNPSKSTLLSYVCNAIDIVIYEKLVRSHLYNCLLVLVLHVSFFAVAVIMDMQLTILLINR